MFTCAKILKTIIRLRLGDYRGIFTSTSSRRIFPDNHLALRRIIVKYLTVILRTRVEYELIADEARSAESAIARIRRE
jgi:hypothetical protein